MTDRQKKLDAITDAMYYYMVELVSQANLLEDIGYDKDGEDLRSLCDDLERLAIRIMSRKHKRNPAV